MYTIIHYLFSHFIQVLSFYHKHSDLTTNFDIYIYQSSIFPSSTFISKYPKSSRQSLQFITPSTLLLFRLQTRATQRYFPPFQKISLQNIKLHYIFQTIFHQDNFYAIHHFLAPSPNTSLTLHKNLPSSPQKSFEKLLPRSKIIRHLDKPTDSPPFSRFIPFNPLLPPLARSIDRCRIQAAKFRAHPRLVDRVIRATISTDTCPPGIPVPTKRVREIGCETAVY